ncbi:MAG TPA: EAL domain-containing protein, partial [Methylotenera sp.]|nr:EAL domain-containing protein [Methylotenera sp.]
ESMFRGLAENSVVGVYIVQDGIFRFVNPKMAEMFAYEQSEMIASAGVFDIVTKDDRHLVELSIQQRLRGEINEIHYECRARRKNGSAFDAKVFGSKMELDGKTATIGIMLDITERKRVDRALRVLSACNQALVRATEESALLADICRIVQEVSGYPFVWVGYAEDDPAKRVRPVALAEAEEGALISKINNVSWDDSETGKGATGTAIRTSQAIVVKDLQTNALYAPWREFAARHAILSAMSQPLKVGNKILGALTVYSQEADTFTVDEIRIAEELADNLAYGITALRADAAGKHYAQQLEHQANYDILTGLANRNLLSDRLKQAIASAQRSGQMVAVLLHDLDHFKVINDSLGHAAGDALLQAMAGRLRSSVRETDTVARLGGDEFVIVIPDVTKAEDATAVARKVLDLLSQPFIIENQEMYISASIGISLYPRDGEHEEVLLKNVDLAMFRAKHEGRSNFCFYTEEMNARNQERQAMESELHQALKHGEFLLHYQPKVNLRTGEVVGAEALIRWQRSEGEIIFPEKFIPLSEETGLIHPIGAWVMKTACAQNRAWQDAGLPPVSIAVNLSARQFRQHDLVGMVRQVLQDTGLEPQYLELELTESVIMQEAEEAISTLLELKALGVQLSLDDFGTGYSSLNYLRRFPLDNLKIDRSFVKGITSNPHDTTIVKTVIALAHSLNLKVIAEGVETEEQLAFLKAHDCDEMQGYIFSKPVPHEKLSGLLEAGRLD